MLFVTLLYFFFIVFWWCLAEGSSKLSQNTSSWRFLSLLHPSPITSQWKAPPSPPFLLLESVRSRYACQWISSVCYGFSVRLFCIYFLSVYLYRCLPSQLPLMLPTVPCHSPHLLLGVGFGVEEKAYVHTLPFNCNLPAVLIRPLPRLVPASRFQPPNKNWFSYFLGHFTYFLEIFSRCRFCLLLTFSLDLVIGISFYSMSFVVLIKAVS